MKLVTSMSASTAREFFLKPESYFNFDLPKYFNFKPIIKQSDALISGKNFKNAIIKSNAEAPNRKENVDYVLIHNKDGKYAWRPFELIHPILYVNLVNDICEKKHWECTVFKSKQETYAMAGMMMYPMSPMNYNFPIMPNGAMAFPFPVQFYGQPVQHKEMKNEVDDK